MTAVQYKRRIAAVKTADAINAIEGVPVSRYAQVLSSSWARGDQRRADEGGASGLPRKAGHRCGTVVDPYCYEDTPVLRNTLDIRDEKTLYLIEAEQSRANMMLLYEQGFHDFTPEACGTFTVFCSGTFTSGQASTGSSISQSGKSCLRAAACGTATMTPLRMIWFRPFRIFSVRIGRRCPEKRLYRLSFGALRRSGRYIRSVKGTPGRW